MAVNYTKLPANQIAISGSANANASRLYTITLPNNLTIATGGELLVSWHTGTGNAGTGTANENRNLNTNIFVPSLDAASDSHLTSGEWVTFEGAGRGAALIALEGQVAIGTSRTITLRVHNWSGTSAANLSGSGIGSIWYRNVTLNATELNTLLTGLTSEDTLTDDQQLIILTDGGVRRALISDFPSGEASAPTIAQIATALGTANSQNTIADNDELIIRRGTDIIRSNVSNLPVRDFVTGNKTISGTNIAHNLLVG